MKFGGIFDLEAKEKESEELKVLMVEANFWEAQEKANEVVGRLKYLKGIIEPFQKASQDCKDFQELCELLELEEVPEADSHSEFERTLLVLEKDISQIELQSLLSNKLDPLNAIVSINAGAGGTESCDWVDMILRMYEKWAATRGFEFSILDLLPGEEAGVKNVTFLVKGALSYGYLKAERGVSSFGKNFSF